VSIRAVNEFEIVSWLPLLSCFQFHTFCGEILITLGLASILYLTFETPFMLIENYFYNKRKMKTEAQKPVVRVD
jgi:hypothetical protein